MEYPRIEQFFVSRGGIAAVFRGWRAVLNNSEP
jgi:hypothetical protein